MADGNDTFFPPINLISSSGIFASDDRPVTMHGSRPVNQPSARTQRARTARYGGRHRSGKLGRAPGLRQAQRARQRHEWNLPPKIETADSADSDSSWEEEPCDTNTKPRDNNKKNETAKRKGSGVDVKRIYRPGLSQGDYDRLLNMKIKQKPHQSQSHSLKLPHISSEEKRIRTEQAEKQEHKVKLDTIIKTIKEGSTVKLPSIYRNINVKPINLKPHLSTRATAKPCQSKEVLINKATRARFEQNDGFNKSTSTKYIMNERAKLRQAASGKIKMNVKEMKRGRRQQTAKRHRSMKTSEDDASPSKQNVDDDINVENADLNNAGTLRKNNVDNLGNHNMHGKPSLHPVAIDPEERVRKNQSLEDNSKRVSFKSNQADQTQTSTSSIQTSKTPTKTSINQTHASRNLTQALMKPTKTSTNRTQISTVPTQTDPNSTQIAKDSTQTPMDSTQTSTNTTHLSMNPNQTSTNLTYSSTDLNQTSTKAIQTATNQTETTNSQIQTKALEAVEKKFKQLEKSVVKPIEKRFDKIEESAKKHRKEIDEKTEKILSKLEKTMRSVKKTEAKFSAIEKKSENVDILERTLHELETNLNEMNTVELEQKIELVEERLSGFDERLNRVRKSAGLNRTKITDNSDDSNVNEGPVTSLGLEPQQNAWANRLDDELSDKDKRSIQRNFYHLKGKLDPDEVVDILFSAEVISAAKLKNPSRKIAKPKECRYFGSHS